MPSNLLMDRVSGGHKKSEEAKNIFITAHDFILLRKIRVPNCPRIIQCMVNG
jgi:hypothetical protein